MSVKAILHFVSSLILHLEFVMKKACLSDFYLIGFPFLGIFCIFTHLFDLVCHVDVHEAFKAQQTAEIAVEVLAVVRFICLN